MNNRDGKLHVTIDNRGLEIRRGATIQEAAEANGVYIPTLCAHKDLTPYGGCRMCIVEVEGMRGFPTACTTPVEEGMIIRTRTAQIQSVRNEIFNLILSEHPCSCLICDEQEECKQYSVTVRKVGVTTGCRFCSNDGQCELQEVAAKIGVKELNYPIYYRNLPVEKEDPFYDRDYNLCILCGRCVRICQEIRAANAISFKQRGRHTTIGPAFKRTHLEAGCEFCGACVSVCPTGALSEKSRKWRGKEDRAVTTTCALCGIGCQVKVLVKQDEVMGALPAEEPQLNDGQLCVKGRFGITEMVNTYRRLKRYQKLEEGMQIEVTPDEGLTVAAKTLSACRPDEFGMLISPNCSNEDLYIAQKFTRAVMGSNQIDTIARRYYGDGFDSYLKLFNAAAEFSDLRRSSVIISIGLDTRYGRSVVGVALRRAVHRGARIITIHPRHHNLEVMADVWLSPSPGDVADLLDNLATLMQKTKQPVVSRGDNHPEAIAKAVAVMRESPSPVILVGSEFTHERSSGRIYDAIGWLAQTIGAHILPLPAFNNLIGSVRMSAYPNILPGAQPISDKTQRIRIEKLWGAAIPDASGNWMSWESQAPKQKLKVLYVIGEDPAHYRHLAEFVIAQNTHPSQVLDSADLVFPAAAFTESNGTFYNQEARLLRVNKVVDPPGDALPDWQIISRLARRMDKKGFDAETLADIQTEIDEVTGGFAGHILVEPIPVASAAGPRVSLTPIVAVDNANSDFPIMLRVAIDEHTYRGYPLSQWVGGLEILFPKDVISINSADAARLGIGERDKVKVVSRSFERVWTAAVSGDQPCGEARVTLKQDELVGGNPFPVTIRKSYV